MGLTTKASDFRARLVRATGLTEAAISAAWPEWWSDAADASSSAQAELRFSLARKLGLDPTSLIDDETPRFLWKDVAKYKNFSGDEAGEQPAITSFGISLARILVSGVTQRQDLIGLPASELREKLLSNQLFIRLVDMLGLLWGLGVPTIHLKVYPLAAKRMCAMSVRVSKQAVILLAREASYPAWPTFHVAHEIGHIALQHVADDGGLVDMDDTATELKSEDEEELAADRYALELLTGDPEFTIEKRGVGSSPRELAARCLEYGPEARIEPGTMALCYGHATGEWPTVQRALTHIYDAEIPVWSVINKIASLQIAWDEIRHDNATFLRAVMGGS